MIIREFIKVVDYFRREFLYRLDKNYFKNKLSKREGQCIRCGACCKGCPELDKNTNLCKVYHNRNPRMCHVDFPLDKWDQKLFATEKTCGYRFKK